MKFRLWRQLTPGERAILAKLNQMETRIMPALDDLKAAVTGAVAEMGDAVTSINSLSKQIADAAASNDTAALSDLTGQLTAATASLKTTVDDLAQHPAASAGAPTG